MLTEQSFGTVRPREHLHITSLLEIEMSLNLNLLLLSLGKRDLQPQDIDYSTTYLSEKLAESKWSGWYGLAIYLLFLIIFQRLHTAPSRGCV
jgi:hypothetical protein